MKSTGIFNGRNNTRYAVAGFGGGSILPDQKSSLVRKIVEARKYFAHTGRGKTELANFEHEYAKTFGLISFIIQFDWFTSTELKSNPAPSDRV